MIRYIYTFFVGLFVAIFVGMGIAVFYEAPAQPEPPVWEYVSKVPTDAEKEAENAFIAQSRIYDEKMSIYNRNVSVIVLICSVIIMAIALIFSEKLGVLADGLLLGGIFSLLYGVGRGMSTDSNIYRFIVASMGLAITLILGYIKFNRPHSTDAVAANKSESH